MSTLVVYDDTSDGQLTSQSQNSFAEARSGYSLSVDTSGDTFFAVSSPPADEGYPWTIEESFIRFDTSSLGSSTVSAAVLRMYVLNSVNAEVQARVDSWGPTLTTGDWTDGTGNALAAHLAGNYSVAQYLDFADDALPAHVIKNGFTELVLILKSVVDNYDPSSDGHGQQFWFRSADYAGTTYDPKLTVTYGPTIDVPAITTAMQGLV